MANKLDIAQLGADVIRKNATEVIDIDSSTTQKFIDDVMHTCKIEKGMGIAAPQVYQSRSIFIMSSEPNERYPNALKMEPVAIINPKIIFQSKEKIKDWEGCLSLPGIRALVPRYKKIDVSYTNRNGEEVNKVFEGFLARIFQHEFDHLNGTVFIDRVESTQDIVMEAEYYRIIKSFSE